MRTAVFRTGRQIPTVRKISISSKVSKFIFRSLLKILIFFINSETVFFELIIPLQGKIFLLITFNEEIIISTSVADSIIDTNEQNKVQYDVNSFSELDRENILIEMRKDMLLAAETMEFEKAAKIRDEITELEKL